MSGDEVREARQRAGWTQERLAREVGVVLRSIGNWERVGPPAGKVAKLRQVLGPYLEEGPVGPSLRSASDAELLLEVARRMERARQEGGGRGGDTAPTNDELARRRQQPAEEPAEELEAVAAEDSVDPLDEAEQTERET